VRPGFEGGQMPLIRRVPKRGFTSPFREANQVVNLKHLDRIAGTDVTPDTLKAAGLVDHADAAIKVLAMGEATRAYAVRGCAVSAGARAKIEQAGGRIEE
jgi:large subunit ribosomal protein L15